MNEFLFGVLPYISATLFVAVPIIRRRRGGFSFTTRASGFFERQTMGLAALMFHWGIIVLFVGHICGLIGGLATSMGWIDVFHWIGLAGGVAALYGALLALLRRIVVPEMRATSRSDDYLVLVFLIAIMSFGLYPVIAEKSFGLSMTAGPWIKSLASLSPDVAGMAGMPILSKIHITLAMIFMAYFPFTKLVHLWTVPLRYVTRPYQSMRSYRRVTS